ncbi:MAG: hypothetical protein CM15mP74_00720 [Halieaceae bacterium]|nr:MAG: hypothetical protein CM15mP74_00720 [Halieaceae bacterium]
MGGIAGTQSLTILIRAMAMGQINDRNQFWVVGRESLVGALNGMLWALVIAATAAIWFGRPDPGIHYCLRDADQPGHRGLCGRRVATRAEKITGGSRSRGRGHGDDCH